MPSLPDIPKDTDNVETPRIKNTVHVNHIKWKNTLNITETLAGSYRLFIKTKVINTETDKKEKVKSRHTVIQHRSNILQLLLRMNEYKVKDLPDIDKQVRRQVKRLSKEVKQMNSEQEKIQQVTESFENQTESFDFKQIVKEEAV